MSFDLFFVTSHPVDANQRAAVQATLAVSAVPNSKDDGYIAVEFDDGGMAEVFADDLSEGGMVAVRSGLTPDFLNFLMQILKDGNMMLVPAMENIVTIAASEDAFHGSDPTMPKHVICNSGEELGVLLKEGFESWKRFRDSRVSQ